MGIFSKEIRIFFALLVLIGGHGCTPRVSFVPISTETHQTTTLPKTATPTNLPIIADFSQKGWFVYVCQVETGRDVCLVSPDRNKIIQMGLNKIGRVSSPSWSSNGQIVFEVDQKIYIVDMDCINNLNGCLENTHIISPNKPGQFIHPSWSPNGQKIAYAYRSNTDDEFKIWLMDSDGSNAIQLTNIDGNDPVWSPDGEKIAFNSSYQWAGGDSDFRGNIYVMSKDGSNIHKLTEELPDSYAPDWSPNGDWIVVMSRDGKDLWEPSNRPTLIKVRIDGSELVRLGPGSVPAWSPDGANIAFMAERDELWLMDTDGANLRKIPGIFPMQKICWQPYALTSIP